MSHLFKLLVNSATQWGCRKIVQKSLTVRNTNLVQKRFSGSKQNFMKVTVVGSAGKIGQPLCVMLKQSPLIDELCLYDIKQTNALALELNHIDTKCTVTSFCGKENIGQALQNSKIIVVLASKPDADLLSAERMWSQNAKVIKDVMTDIAKHCPKAFLAIGTNPINSIIPLACEILKKLGIFNASAVFGITCLDTVRANTFVAQVQGIEPETVVVPIIGGNTADTIVPVLSQTKPTLIFTNEELENITMAIRKTRENLLSMKPPETGSLSSAFATARFVISLVKAIQGQPQVVECAYVYSSQHPQLKYFSNPIMLGPSGIMKNLGIPPLSDYEQCLLDNTIGILMKDIKRGEKSAGVVDPPICDPCDPDPRNTKCPHDWCEKRSV